MKVTYRDCKSLGLGFVKVSYKGTIKCIIRPFLLELHICRRELCRATLTPNPKI